MAFFQQESMLLCYYTRLWHDKGVHPLVPCYYESPKIYAVQFRFPHHLHFCTTNSLILF